MNHCCRAGLNLLGCIVALSASVTIVATRNNLRDTETTLPHVNKTPHVDDYISDLKTLQFFARRWHKNSVDVLPPPPPHNTMLRLAYLQPQQIISRL